MVRRLLSAVVLASLIFVVGCGGSGADKLSGVRTGGVKTLTLATTNSDSLELRPWLDEVERLSKGRLRIRVLTGWRGGAGSDYESDLISDVRSGRVDLGWVGTRAWTASGVHSFDALNALFLVDSYSVQEAVLRGVDRQRLLAGVVGAGFEPVALLPGPLHYLLSHRPLRRAADFRGLKIGVTASGVGERSLRELGAVPVALARGASMSGLDGVEANLGDLAARYVGQAPYLSWDAPFGPAVKVVFANRRTWSSLSQGDRVILRQAADRAFTRTLSAARDNDRAAVAQLCDSSVRLVTVGTRGLDALRLAVGPVYDEVRRRADARAGLQAVERGRTGGRDVPQSLACKTAARSPVSALAGTFMWTMRRGEPGSEYVNFGHGTFVRFKLELRFGRAVETAVFTDGHSEPGFDEKYSVYRDRITFGGDHGPPDTARWRLDGNQLRFTEFSQQNPEGQLIFTSHPWIRQAR